jgi:hypothetical protein
MKVIENAYPTKLYYLIPTFQTLSLHDRGWFFDTLQRI